MPATASSPWYKHIWPWIIVGMLATSVGLTLHMVYIATSTQDTLVTDNYYEAGKGISRSLDRERLAVDLHLQARATLDEVTGEVSLLLSGDSRPETLEMNLISPTQAEKDRNLTLKRSSSEPDRYIGQVPEAIEGRRFVELLGQEGEQTWRLFEEEKVGPGIELKLGDEPIPGAETQR
jgi:hypothetical protein